jgi:hypothetical protein
MYKRQAKTKRSRRAELAASRFGASAPDQEGLWLSPPKHVGPTEPEPKTGEQCSQSRDFNSTRS